MEVLPITSWVELFDKKKFAKLGLDENFKTFVIYVAILEVTTIMPIYSLRTFQVYGSIKFTIAALQWNKTLTKILAEYFDYANIFLTNLAMELPKNTSINKHTIELIKRKQLLYKSIYVLSPMKLETLKTYIENYLKTRFI